MASNNFDNLVEKLQTNKMRLFQNKEELAGIIKSFDIQIEPETKSLNVSHLEKKELKEAEKPKLNQEEIPKEKDIVNKLDFLIEKFSKRHNFNFKFLENHEIMKENEEPNVQRYNPPQPADDIIARIKNRVFKKEENLPIPQARNLSPEIDEKIEKIKQKILNKTQKESIFEKTIEKKEIYPKNPINYDFFDNSNDFENSLKQSTNKKFMNSLKDEKILDLKDFISNRKQKTPEKNTFFIPPQQRENEKILSSTPKKKESPIKFQQKQNVGVFIQNKKKNFKENIKKLKEIYYDKNFIEKMGKEENTEYFENNEILKNSSHKTNKSKNLQFSLNFSDSKNYSSPNVHNEKQNFEIFPSSEEKNNSFVKRIDFESELNYSVSQKDSPLKQSLVENDPILRKLYVEAQGLTDEIEKLKKELRLLERNNS